MFSSLINRRNRAERGQGLVEYALILVLVAVVVIVILSALGPAISNIFGDVTAALTGATSQQCYFWDPVMKFDIWETHGETWTNWGSPWTLVAEDQADDPRPMPRCTEFGSPSFGFPP